MENEYNLLRTKLDLMEDKLVRITREMDEVKQDYRRLELWFSVLLAILLAIFAATIFELVRIVI